MRKYLPANSGQTLLEALIALSLLIIILTAISVAILTSLNNSTFIKQRNQANKLAQQGVEYLRDQILNSDQYDLYSTYYTGSRCLTLDNTLKDTPCDPSQYIYGAFKREVKFSPGSCGLSDSTPNGVEVAITVSWTSGKCNSPFCNVETVKSCFLDPNAYPTTVPTTFQGI